MTFKLFWDQTTYSENGYSKSNVQISSQKCHPSLSPPRAARRERRQFSAFFTVQSRDVTDFRENGKSTLIVVEYKPLLAAFVTIVYC